MIVERPRANSLGRRIEDVSPNLTGKDLVTAPPVTCLHAQGPCAVRVDPILQTVQVKAMAIFLVAVQNMDVETLTGLGVDDGPGNTTVPRRFVDVRGNQLGFVR